MIKSIKVLLCGKNVIYCHFFDKIIPSGRIVVPSGRIAVPLMGGFLVLEGKFRNDFIFTFSIGQIIMIMIFLGY